jgi:putative transposase
MSWKEFIQSHMDVTWAADLFTEEVWTLSGLVTCYVLFFIHLGTRRVWVAGCTPHPDAAWMRQQARNFSIVIHESERACRYLIHDNDTVFRPFDAVAKAAEIKIVKTPPWTPLCNAFAERHVRECRETLDRMILIGEGHLHHVVKKIESHHNAQRPHQGLDNGIPMGFDYPPAAAEPDDVCRESSLGGLLNHYHAAKAA